MSYTLIDPAHQLHDAENDAVVDYVQLFNLRQTIKNKPVDKHYIEDVRIEAARRPNKKEAALKTTSSNTSVFRFKTKEECESQRKSMKYYMKKDEILDIIKRNGEFSKLMPKKYSTLNKKDLCQEVIQKIIKN
jgi:hypothetical protein